MKTAYRASHDDDDSTTKLLELAHGQSENGFARIVLNPQEEPRDAHFERTGPRLIPYVVVGVPLTSTWVNRVSDFNNVPTSPSQFATAPGIKERRSILDSGGEPETAWSYIRPALAAVAQCAAELERIHAENKCHFDVKKIVVGGDGQATLGRCLPSPTAVAKSAILYLPNETSPECLGTSSRYTAKSDIWHLGILGFQLITGKLPYSAASSSPELLQMLNNRPSFDNLVLDAATTDLFVRMLKKDPKQRPTAQQVRREVEGILATKNGV